MSWSQEYDVESVETLLERLTGKTAYQLLEHEAYMQGFRIVQLEDVFLNRDVQGKLVYLGDGRVFVPKLVEKFTSDGNYGRDSFRYVLEGEAPEVKYVDEEHGIELSEIVEDEGTEFENHGC